MRISMDIDDQLMADAMRASGLDTIKATVEEALRHLIHTRRIQALDEMRGLGWEGDLDEMRNDWTPDMDWGLKDKR